jgi:hypothetical protein
MIRLWDWVLRFIGGDWDHLDYGNYRNDCEDADECLCEISRGDEDPLEHAMAMDLPE